MEELGALIKIATDANKTNTDSPLETEELLNINNSDGAGKGETAIDQQGDDVEEDEIVIKIPETLSEDAKVKIRNYYEEILAKRGETVPFKKCGMNSLIG